MRVIPFIIFCVLFVGEAKSQFDFKADSLLAIEYFNIADTSYLDVPKCLKYTKMAIPLLKKTEQWEKYIYCLNALSYCYNQLEDYKSMEEGNKLALSEAKRLLPPTHELFAGALNNLGYFYYIVREDYDKAEKIYLDGLSQVPESNDSIPLVIRGALYENLGSVKRKAGDFEVAIEYLNEAKRLHDIGYQKYLVGEVPVNIRKVVVLQNRALLFHFLERYDDAINDLKSALTELEKGSRRDERYFVKCYTALADNYLEIRELSKAKEVVNSALSFKTNKSILKSEIEHVRGKIAFATGDRRNGQLFLNSALTLLPESRKVSRGIIYLSLAKGNLSLDAYGESFKYSELGLAEISNKETNGFVGGNNFPSLLDAINILTVRAKSLSLKNRDSQNSAELKKTFEAWQWVSQLVENLQKEFSSEASKIYLTEIAVENYELAAKYAHEVYSTFVIDEKRYAEAEEFLRWMLFFSEKSRAAVLEGEWTKRKSRGLFPALDTLLNKQSKLRVELNYAQKMAKKKSSKSSDSFWKNEELKLRRAIDEVGDEMKGEFPQYNSLLSSDYFDQNEIKNKLGEEGAVIAEYFVVGDSIFLFELNADTIHFHVIENGKHLREEGETILSNLKLSSIDGILQFKNAGRELYKALIEPLSLSPQQRLIIVPDDWLSYIPFDVFLTQDINNDAVRAWPFLVKEHPISFVWSATLWSQFELKNKQVKNVFALAPVFEGTPQYLKYSKEELSSFHGIDSKILLREKATVHGLRSNAPKFDIIHLSTHASASAENVEPVVEMIDGEVAVSDLQLLQLKAKMAVLSACETQIGEHQKGEGVMSLSRAFAYAGVPSVVATLWSVNERSTADLMKVYYENIFAEKSKDIALQKAKVVYLENCSDIRTAPYYWSGISLTGDASALKIQSTPNYTCLLISSLFLLLIVLFFIRKRRQEN